MPQTQAIRADARFDALVNKEMQEHKHLISSHNKEMQQLRDELRLALQKCESLSDRSHKDLNELRERTECQILILKDKGAHEALIISEQKQAIDSLHDKLNSFHESQASKEDLDSFKKDMESKLSDCTTSNLVSFQDCHRMCKELFNGLKDEMEKRRMELRQNIFEGIEDVAKKFSQTQLDKEGIDRELIRYKKAMFYIEKKIENIYTLIERINKRGEACHKQE